MTVGELIAQLAALPPDLPVYVRDYEAGVNDVERVVVGSFQRDRYDESYFGQHGDRGEGDRGTPGVELMGRNRLAGAAKEESDGPC